MGFLEPPISGAPQPVAPHALREGPFAPGSSLVALFAFLAAIARLGRAQRLVLSSGRQPHAPALLLRPRADRPSRTGLTVFEGKLHEDGTAACPGALIPPRYRPFALRTADPLLRPIYFKLLDGVAPIDLRLPPLWRPG